MDDDFFLQPIRNNTDPDKLEKDGTGAAKDTPITPEVCSDFSICLGRSDDAVIQDVIGDNAELNTSPKELMQNFSTGKKYASGKIEHVGDKKSDCTEKIFKTIKFYVKKGRVFEIRRLTRRIQLLSKKKGSEREVDKNKRKVSNILVTIEEIKNISIDSICSKFTAVLQGLFAKIGLEMDEPSAQINWVEMLSNSSSSEGDLGLVHCLRLLHLKSVLARLNEEIKHYYEAYKGASPITKKDKHLSARTTQQSKEREQKQHASNKNSINSKRKSKRLRNNQENESHKLTEMSQNGATGMLEEKVDVPDKSFTVLKSDVPKNKKNANGKKRNNCNVDSNELKVKNFKAQLRKFKNMNGNRLGQRARRELWEKMYGNDAVHVRKGIKSKQKPKVVKNQAGLMGGRRQTSRNVKIQEQRKTNETKMHPSWQAKRNQKLQNQIVKFEGSKIKFDD